MSYYDVISSTENLAKAVKRLPNYLRQKFYESTRDYNSENVATLIEFEKWLRGISGKLVVKGKLPPGSGSRLEAVEPHP